MKVHTSEFKNQIKEFGREIDCIITYNDGDENVELSNELLNSVTPHYKGAILKSVMKQLDIDCNVEIPINTILHLEFGVKVRDDDVDDEIQNDYRKNYDYINFGNYVIKEVEKQEDTESYLIKCYDKMLYSMIDYEKMNISYPITIRNYINTICQHLGLTFKNANDTFANYNKEINDELYLTYDEESNKWTSAGYTFRDVLDELAEVTASTICINEVDDELEIRYINDTNDTIDGEYLKDINVNFGEQTKPINTIVLSRAGNSDKVYLSEPQNLADEAKNAIIISDNQIMGFNNRSSYLPDILNKLYGLTYCLNDFSSTGICYYNLCDRYNINIVKYNEETEEEISNTYSCIMLNDEINISEGLEENIHTDLSEEIETDYTKADKTDRKINQTYIIVDKQNQVIEGVSSRVNEQDEKIATIRLQYNEIMSKVSDIADITISGETTYALLNLNNVNSSQPINIKIHPIIDNISYLYPKDTLYPDDYLYSTTRTLRFINTRTNEVFDWELPTDLWYYDNTTYDELELSYGDGSDSDVIVTRRCGIDNTGTIYPLTTPVSETYSYPSHLLLSDGDYEIKLLSYSTAYLYVQLMTSNIYTTQFYTKAETNSIIDQKANNIELGVNQKLSNYSTSEEMNSAINVKANEITSTVSQTYATKSTTNTLSSRISQTAKDITLQVNNGSTTSGIKIGITKEDGTKSTAQGTIEMTGLVKFSNLKDGTTTISGSNIKTGTIDASNVKVTNINASNITTGTLSANRINGGTIDAESITVKNLNASNLNRGTITRPISGSSISGASMSGGSINGSKYQFTSGSREIDIASNSTYGIITGWYSDKIRLFINPESSGGEFRAYGTSTSSGAYLNQSGVHTYSDIRYKKHIKNIDEKESINIISNLNPICYDYDDNERHRGLSAQEVEKVLKENDIENQIYEINKDGRYTLNYTEFIPDLINCIKYQQEEINNLKKEMEEMKNAKN